MFSTLWAKSQVTVVAVSGLWFLVQIIRAHGMTKALAQLQCDAAGKNQKKSLRKDAGLPS